MDTTIDNNLFNEGLEYAFLIIPDVNTFLEFSDAMLDYMGKDYPYCKPIYSALSNWPGLKFKFQNHLEWENLSDELIVNHYLDYKAEIEIKNRQQEFKENIDELQFLVMNFRKREEFKKLLDFVGKFHYLAPYNAMLVGIQKPGATFVLNGKGWMKYNRRPKLNAQQLITLVPFGPIQCMFDYSETEQITGTSEVSEIQLMKEWDNGLMNTNGAIDKDVLRCLIDNLVMYGIYLDTNFSAANSFGGYIMEDKRHELHIPIFRDEGFEYNSQFSISINKSQSDVVRFHTLCHELGHLFCCHVYYKSDKRRILTKKEREFEAETVAWLVCKRHGVYNPSEEYLATYARDGIIPICSTEYIMKAVTEIEKMMESPVNITKSLWYKEDKDLNTVVDNFKKKKDARIKKVYQQSLFE